MEEGGCYTADEEPGDLEGGCRYAELSSNGYTEAVLSSVGENDWDPVSYFRGLMYFAGEVRGKADPMCLNNTKIAASCKYIVTAKLATSTYICDHKSASATTYI